MTGDDRLTTLGKALGSPPAPDAAAKARHLALALAAFEKDVAADQGSTDSRRQTPVRPKRGRLFKGVRQMLQTTSWKPLLTFTTSGAALGLVITAFLPQTSFSPLSQLADPAPAPMVAATAPTTNTAAPPMPAREKRELTETIAASEAEQPVAPAPLLTQGIQSDDPVARLAEPIETESFANAPANPVQIVQEDPVSTFSIDVDTAAWSILRSSLTSGVLPDPDAIRIEEMVNYFPYDYPGPASDAAPFRPSLAVMQTPWNAQTRLVRIALQGRLPDASQRKPLNLVFLVDTSGSMNEPAKLPLLKTSLGLMLGHLAPEDEIAIVAYAGSAGEVLPPTPAGNRDSILAALDRLQSGGATAGVEGLELAYQIATRMSAPDETSRVILATDGDFNVGVQDPEGLEAYISKQRDSGVYLSVLGFGRGNLDDLTMQTLSQAGNGTASYIDTLQEAQKVLADQLQGTLFPIADDVKIQVEWNPQQVAEYRLIGYETRTLRREDFKNDRIDAGEIGAGHQVTALYEITAPGSPALLNDPLRYGAGTDAIAPQTMGPELGYLRIRYKKPGAMTSNLIETPITAAQGPDEDARFAAAIAGFGALLRGSPYLGDWGWDDAIALASKSRGDDPFGYRGEAVNLMRLAKSLSQ